MTEESYIRDMHWVIEVSLKSTVYWKFFILV